jgi:DNA polymerase-3 subunit alpha
MAAVMSADLDNTDRLVVIKDDCRKSGLKLLPPDVNQSAYQFSVADDESILYGLGAIKGVGHNAVDAVRSRE